MLNGCSGFLFQFSDETLSAAENKKDTNAKCSRGKTKSPKTPHKQHILAILYIYCHIWAFFFSALVACQGDRSVEQGTRNHIGQLPRKPLLSLTRGKFLLRTEESGQHCVRRGLHLKRTAPEKALVVQREGRRGGTRFFHQQRLRKRNGRQTDITQIDARIPKDGWIPFSVSAVNTSALAALCDSLLHWSHGIKRGSDYGLLVCEVFEGELIFSARLSEIWLMAPNNTTTLIILFYWKWKTLFLWCYGGIHWGISFYKYIPYVALFELSHKCFMGE